MRDSFLGLIGCVLIAALITALIHSSSATIGIVMGLGAAGILDWQTAVAFSLGADLGTTITSWMASLNLSKNAKRAAYAHISFNFLGVAVMLPLFFLSMQLLTVAMQWFGGDPAPGHRRRQGDLPLVPVAIGLYSTAFNIFNTLLLFPFVGVFERYLSRVGHTEADDIEDYSTPKYLDRAFSGDLLKAVPAVQQETLRDLEAGAVFLDIARGAKSAPKDPGEHFTAVDILNRDIRAYSASLFREDMPYDQLDLVASLIEEADFTASLAEALHQVARRVKREKFGKQAREIVDAALLKLDHAMRADHAEWRRRSPPACRPAMSPSPRSRSCGSVLNTGAGISAIERGAILAILGSVERADLLINRIDAERRSVNRADVLARITAAATRGQGRAGYAEPEAVPAQ